MENLADDRNCCPLCLESIEYRYKAILPCGHAIHQHCLRILEVNLFCTCPVCRCVWNPEIYATHSRVRYVEQQIVAFARQLAQNYDMKRDIERNALHLRYQLADDASRRYLYIEQLELLYKYRYMLHDLISAENRKGALAGNSGQCSVLPTLTRYADRKSIVEKQRAHSELRSSGFSAYVALDGKLFDKISEINGKIVTCQYFIDKLTDRESKHTVMLERMQMLAPYYYAETQQIAACGLQITREIERISRVYERYESKTTRIPLPQLACNTCGGSDSVSWEQQLQQRTLDNAWMELQQIQQQFYKICYICINK